MKISLDANVYDKDVILFVLTNYDIEYNIIFNNNQREIQFSKNIDSNIIAEIKQKINEQQLRKDIALQNRKIRESIIAAALSLPESN